MKYQWAFSQVRKAHWCSECDLANHREKGDAPKFHLNKGL